MTGERLGYRPGLDGLRGVAVLAVMASHAGPPGYGHGSIGVSVFFTLSGFLITSLLLEERGRGGVSLRGFYLRRARRLLPALPAALAAMALVDMAAGRPVTGHLLAAGTYTSNLYQLGSGERGAFSHLWSLAIEEQFYLLWPLVVVAVPRLWRLCLVAITVVLAARLLLPLGEETLYRGTFFRVDALLAGCALALRPIAHRWLLPVGGVVLCAVAFVGTGPELMRGWSLPVLAGSVAVVAGSVHRSAPGWLIHVGRTSYGLYLWHFVFARWGWDHDWSTVQMTVGVFGGGFLAAELSWRYVESRWLRRPDESHPKNSDIVGERVSRVGAVATDTDRQQLAG